jgi:hypothetical protein
MFLACVLARSCRTLSRRISDLPVRDSHLSAGVEGGSLAHSEGFTRRKDQRANVKEIVCAGLIKCSRVLGWAKKRIIKIFALTCSQ